MVQPETKKNSTPHQPARLVKQYMEGHQDMPHPLLLPSAHHVRCHAATLYYYMYWIPIVLIVLLSAVSGTEKLNATRHLTGGWWSGPNGRKEKELPTWAGWRRERNDRSPKPRANSFGPDYCLCGLFALNTLSRHHLNPRRVACPVLLFVWFSINYSAAGLKLPAASDSLTVYTVGTN